MNLGAQNGIRPCTHTNPYLSLLRILSYPTMVTTWSRKTALFATLLSSQKAQYFSLTNSILLISLLLCGETSSLQPEGHMWSLETKLYFFLGRWTFPAGNLLDNLKREKREKRVRGEVNSRGEGRLFFLFCISPFSPLLTHLISEQETMTRSAYALLADRVIF